MNNVVNFPKLEVINNEPVASSINIAETFGKRHDNIMRDIRQAINEMQSLEGSIKGLLNFEESSYKNQQGKEQPCYLMNRDAFCFIVMGFTGKKAFEWKLKYIEAFNAMEAELRKQYEAEQLGDETLTASEQQLVREMVLKVCDRTGMSHAAIYPRLANKFRVAKYQQLARSQLADVMAYLAQMEPKGSKVVHLPPKPAHTEEDYQEAQLELFHRLDKEKEKQTRAQQCLEFLEALPADMVWSDYLKGLVKDELRHQSQYIPSLGAMRPLGDSMKKDLFG